jgi:peptidoglycan/LPS O-acetylase OafA/YrhL
MHYRPDIDGLRALAVLAVLIFHAFPSALPGGFVGVDIFFVISGYLITTILLKQMETHQFSLAHFYAQRIKRIFPALATVLIFCLWVGWIALSSGEYKQLGRYTAGGAAFLNNFLFWRDAGYFDTAAATKPLLHLWSLAIEEQFYLIWPLLLLICHKLSHTTFKARSKAVLIGAIFCTSLIYSYQLVVRDLTADFYSPFARSWELIVGAALAYWHQQSSTLLLSKRISLLLAVIGGGLLLAGVTLIDHTRAFPGLWALLPTLGTACLIAAGPSSYINRQWLASRPLVWIGLISYSLYLWHWPLLTFARIFEGQTPTVSVRCLLLLASAGLAFLTYQLIERPIRFPNSHRKTSKTVVSLLCVIMLVLLIVGYAITRNEGLPFRHYQRLNADSSSIVLGGDRSLLKHACGMPKNIASQFEWCLSQDKTTPPNFAVIGDSKGEALYYGLARESRQDENWMMLGSFPTFKLQKDTQPPNLLELALRQLERDPSIQTIVLVSSYRHLFPTDHINGFIQKNYSDADIEQAVDTQNEVVQRLQQANKKVVFFIDNPTLPDPSSCIEGEMTSLPALNRLLYRAANPNCQMTYTNHLVGTAAYQQFIKQLAWRNPALIIFNPAPFLCDIPANKCTYHEAKHFLYSYGDHISDYANSKLAKLLLPLLRGQ